MSVRCWFCDTQVKPLIRNHLIVLIPSQYNIRSYPTTILYNNSIPHQFTGHHTAADLVEFVEVSKQFRFSLAFKFGYRKQTHSSKIRLASSRFLMRRKSDRRPTKSRGSHEVHPTGFPRKRTLRKSVVR